MKYLPSIIGGKQLRGVSELPSSTALPLLLNDAGELFVDNDGSGEFVIGELLAARLLELESFLGSSNILAFEDVDAVAVDYSDQAWHPNPTVFLLNEFGEFDQAFPILTYDSAQQLLVISFAGDVVSGYLILN